MLYNVYFSAKGTTKKCAQYIASEINMEMREYNWLVDSERKEIDLMKEDVLLLSMPVYGGFIPKICIPWTERLKGHGTPAIIAAVYGNRHYDNALIQMKELLEKQGFVVIAAGAFLAEHSIFPTVAAGRPDEEDRSAMRVFAGRCRHLVERGAVWENRKIEVPGKTDYDPSAFKGVAFQPDGDDTCTACRKCVEVCPQHAISAENPRITKSELCISCGACIHVCITGARDYHGEKYHTGKAGFEERCAEYRKPEMYYIC